MSKMGIQRLMKPVPDLFMALARDPRRTLVLARDQRRTLGIGWRCGKKPSIGQIKDKSSRRQMSAVHTALHPNLSSETDLRKHENIGKENF